MSATVDTLTARFDLRERLGGDRTGTVCRAVDKQSASGQTAVAVKLIDPQLTQSATVAQRLERELKQLERIQHSGIAKVIASGKRGEQTWVATELVDGGRPLSDVVRSHGPLSAAHAAELVELIGEALIEAAQVGVVHHDLAPKNVLLAGNELKLINFSVAVPGTDACPGVPEFVAPEQVEGKPADQRSNIYSLGILFYYALTGRTPFEGEPAVVRAAHTTGTVTPPSQLASIPAELEALILRSLERAPSKRFLTVRQFVDEVVRVSRGGGGENMKTTQPLGRAGKPKAEVVQTLLGMPGEQLRSAAAALKAKEAAAAEAASSGGPRAPTTIGAAPAPAGDSLSGPPAMPVPVGASGVPAMPALAASYVSPEVASAPTQATPVISAAPLSADRSPWAQPGGAMADAAAAVAAAAPALAEVKPATLPVAEPALPLPTPAAYQTSAAQVAQASQSAAAAAPAAQASQASQAAPAAASSVGAPTVGSANPSGSSRRKRPENSKGKGKFRETLWFKKGELDAAAAEAAAVERARTGKDVDRDKADSLPMDERYKDDGSLSNTDHDRYSLKTGGTQAMPVLKQRQGTGGDVSEDELISEMKAGRGKYVIAIVVAVVALGALLFLLMG